MITPIAPIAIYADYAGTFEVRDRNEARLRITPQNGDLFFGADYVNTPLARVALFDRQWRYQLAYAPSFTASDLQSSSLRDTQIFHTAGALASWRDRFVTLILSEDLTYGAVNFAFLAPNPTTTTTPTTPTTTPNQPSQPSQPTQSTQPTTPPSTQTQTPNPTQGLPSPGVVETGSTNTNLLTRVRLDRRTNAFASVGFVYAGGIDAASRLQVPQQWGPRGDVGFDHRVSRLDTMVTRVTGNQTDFSQTRCPGVAVGSTVLDCKPHDLTVTGTETWLHRLTPSTIMTLTAGGGVVRTRNRAGESNRTVPIVTALASYQYTTEIDTQRTLFRFDIGVSPVTDLRLGTMDSRASAGVTMTVPIQRYTVIASVVGARTLVMLTDTQSIKEFNDAAAKSNPTPGTPVAAALVGGVSLFRADVELTYRVTPILTLGGGVRSAWQYQEGLGAFNAHVIFAQATFIAPTMKF